MASARIVFDKHAGRWIVEPVGVRRAVVKLLAVTDRVARRRKPGGVTLTERQWQDQVVALADVYGWRHYHTLWARGSDPGWPDLVLCKPPQLIVAELKTDRGRLTVAQREWLADLTLSGIETRVWRPMDFDVVHDRLKRREPAPVTRTP